MALTAEAFADLSDNGFVLVHGVLESATVEDLRRVVGAITNGHEHNRRTYAARNLLSIPAIAAVAGSPVVRDLVTPVLGERVRAVRGLLFNKVAEANWAVPWHQDLTIAVRERREAAGFGPWSVKEGVVHVCRPYGAQGFLLIANHGLTPVAITCRPSGAGCAIAQLS